MTVKSTPIIQKPAVRQILIGTIISIGLLVLTSYVLLLFQVKQQQKLSGKAFMTAVTQNLNNKIIHQDKNFTESFFVKTPAIANYYIIIFEPTGRILSLSSDNNRVVALPNWSLSNQRANQIFHYLGGLEAWQSLDNNYRVYIKVNYVSLLSVFKNPVYLLPLLLGLGFIILSSFVIQRRYDTWQAVVNYIDDLPRIIQHDYRPLQLTKGKIAPEILQLAQIINRLSYKLYQQLDTIRHLTHRHSTLVDNAPVALFLMNRKGRLLYFNDQFSHIFATPFDKTVIYMISDFITGIDKTAQQLLAKITENHLSLTLPVTNLQRNVYFDMRINPYYNRFGRLQGFSGGLEVVTAYREQLQQAWLIQQQHDEQIASFDKLWAVLGHELRTPLSGMLGMLDGLTDDTSNLTAQQLEAFDTVQQSGFTMLQLLNDMLDVAKMEAGKLHTQVDSTDLLTLLRQTGELMIGNARRQQISLYTYIDPLMPRYIDTDAARLRQILLNLMSNAVKFTKAGYVAIIAERLRADDPLIQTKNLQNTTANYWMRIMIKDTGIGIDAKEQQRLFSYFNQANDSISRQFGGTGLGLAISNNFAHMLGGFIHLNSQIDIGSEFQLYLPLIRSNTKPILPFEGRQPPIFLIFITPYVIAETYLSKIMQFMDLPCRIFTDINQETINKINAIKLLNLTPVIIIDDVNYKEERPLLLTIRYWNQAIKLLASMLPERQIAPTVLADFQGILQKPISSTILFAQIHHHLNHQSSTQPEKSTQLPVEMAFKQFLQKMASVQPHQDPINKEEHQIFTTSALHSLDSAASQINHQEDSITVNIEDKKPALPIVLLAEDNLVNQKIAIKQLNNLGYNVIVAQNGQEVIDLLAANHNIQIILMDCRMPVMDGLTATKQVRLNYPHIPIIALTANQSDADQADCYAAGMNAVLTKPLNKDALKTIIEQFSPN